MKKSKKIPTASEMGEKGWKTRKKIHKDKLRDKNGRFKKLSTV